MLETSWAWMEIFPLWLTVFYKDDGSPSDNGIGDERMTPSKDESV